ncbi:uncharacterized protein LOC127809135 isoform X1 [Diospyros lotus]|uniref:uncharacterized protein LOC127809135 isoform X1 n=1 Tax=Diospyros lotus TaxID=55363 RepID=UPI0022546034|nr:uncharacterized protein LOC127809135 isoform X1 [Diospyros lotus]
MVLYKQKKNNQAAAAARNRLLISITVLGSAGPIRFVVNEDELVAAVIVTALKAYAREGRLPVLGSDFKDFVLYCPIAGTEVLQLWVRGRQLGLLVLGILCSVRSPRWRVHPWMKKSTQLLGKEMAVGRHGSISLLTLRYLAIEIMPCGSRKTLLLFLRILMLFPHCGLVVPVGLLSASSQV